MINGGCAWRGCEGKVRGKVAYILQESESGWDLHRSRGIHGGNLALFVRMGKEHLARWAHMQATPGGEDGLARGRLKLGRGERILAQYKGSPFFLFLISILISN